MSNESVEFDQIETYRLSLRPRVSQGEMAGRIGVSLDAYVNAVVGRMYHGKFRRMNPHRRHREKLERYLERHAAEIRAAVEAEEKQQAEDIARVMSPRQARGPEAGGEMREAV